MELALYQPDIARNTGMMMRLGACLGVRVHIIHPAGFPVSQAGLRRGGLDYVEKADWLEHDDYPHFLSWLRAEGRRMVLLTTRAETSLYEAQFLRDDVLMMGRETAGVPDAIAADADLSLRIPMRPGLRSFNVAMAASLALGEALRQTGALPGAG
ncbi:tRNA (cytidine/uridine-2'-O-)-methyltransferase [Devosia enhydra]|uniref:tRNA (cytidine(34)-2'-O)-methyltransferase n=1 Tax=Devosia enhydra TaxID=665118 RepID=A0A1K2HWN7_9HYPH|nr:tRNA (cytidine(34)-2'-O)-methyltransferase [Devosia enhydra]SFZ83124.1 tRNA (cytidine/uridine-2'-O-)-methyltransferase [Devosia enhydra]